MNTERTAMKRWGITAILILTLVLLNGCDDLRQDTFQGYIEGEYVYLASPQAGRLETLSTVRGSSVETGALLFTLEAEYERQAVHRTEQELSSATALLRDMETGKRPEEIAMAEAQLSQAKAEAANAAALLRRHENLIKSGGISKQELDDSRAAARATAARVTELSSQVEVYNLPEREEKITAQQATVKAASALAAQARWELAQKSIRAPMAGLVYDTLFREGEWVPAGSPVVQLLPPRNVKIRFFVPERLVGGLRTGGQIHVNADGRSEPFSAVISYVASSVEYTPPIIYSNETRSKLIFMVEARPEPDIAATLHPGQPVSVRLP